METQNIVRERIENLRAKMKQEGISYYLIPTADYHNSEYVNDYFKVREYFSGFSGSNGTLVIGHNEAGLWTDGRYFIQAERELKGSGIRLFRMMEEGVPTIQEYLDSVLTEGEAIGFDGRVMTAEYGKQLEEKLDKKKIRFCQDKDLAGDLWTERPKLPANSVTILPEDISGKSTSDKLKELKEVMKKQNCNAHLLTKLDDLMWIFNLRGGDIECNPVALCYGFFTLEDNFLFIQKEAMTEKLQNYAKENGIQLNKYEDIVPFLTEFIHNETKKNAEEQKDTEKNNSCCGILLDEKQVNYRLYSLLESKIPIVNKENPTELQKAIKNPVELSHIREVYLKDSVVLTRFIYWLKMTVKKGEEQITEYSAAMHLDNMRREAEGFLDLSFPTISGYMENAAMMHYEATVKDHKKVEAKGMLLVDSGGQYQGGTTDVTRTIVLGDINEEIKKQFTAVAIGMLRLADVIFLYGCTGRNLDIIAREPLWRMGIDYKCGTGHGIGYMLNVHEGPQSIRYRYIEGASETVLEEGMLLSDEPGVYKEGSHGIRTENILAVKKTEKNDDGQFMAFEHLTFVPIDLDAIDPAVMQPEDIERLNAYHKAVYEKVSPYLTDEEKDWLKEATREVKVL